MPCCPRHRLPAITNTHRFRAELCGTGVFPGHILELYLPPGRVQLFPACVSRASSEERDKTFARPTARQALPAPLVVQEVARPGDLYDEGSLAERRSPWRNTGALSAAALRSLCRTTDRAHGRVCCAAAPSCPTPHRAVIPTPAGHSRGAQPAHAAGSELSPRTGPQLCLARALCVLASTS